MSSTPMVERTCVDCKAAYAIKASEVDRPDLARCPPCRYRAACRERDAAWDAADARFRAGFELVLMVSQR